MKITFPHLGDAHLLAKLFFKDIGVDIVMPLPNTEKTLLQGSPVSPEEICLPFKLMIANLITAYEKGADTAVMPATIGPCRLGEYGELFKNILDKQGYKMNWIILDTANDIGAKELIKRLKLLTRDRNCSMARVFVLLITLYRLILRFEKLEKKAFILCGLETERGACKSILQSCRKKLSDAESLQDGLHIVNQWGKELRTVSIDNKKKPLRILLTGEIFTLIEPFSNHSIEEHLMDFGVSFKKNITIGWWIKNNIINPFYLKWHYNRKNHYMPFGVGGYAKETVEEGLRCKRKNYDGVIQMFPVGCMPEIVAKSVLGYISEKENVKVLTIIFDEMSGEAGFITRLEAFIDMLDFNRKKGERHVLHGNRCGVGQH